MSEYKPSRVEKCEFLLFLSLIQVADLGDVLLL